MTFTAFLITALAVIVGLAVLIGLLAYFGSRRSYRSPTTTSETTTSSNSYSGPLTVLLLILVLGIMAYTFNLTTFVTGGLNDVAETVLNPKTMIFWGVVLFGASLCFSGVLPEEWKGWRKLPAFVGLMLIVVGAYNSGIGIATSRWFEENVEKCLGQEDCPEATNEARSRQSAPKVLAGGVVKAKFDYPTAPIHISRGQKIFWRSTNVHRIVDNGRVVNFDQGADTVIAEAKVGGIWIDYSQLECWEKNEVRAVRWIARYPGPPVDIYYEIYKPIVVSSSGC